MQNQDERLDIKTQISLPSCGVSRFPPRLDHVLSRSQLKTNLHIFPDEASKDPDQCQNHGSLVSIKQIDSASPFDRKHGNLRSILRQISLLLRPHTTWNTPMKWTTSSLKHNLSLLSRLSQTRLSVLWKKSCKFTPDLAEEARKKWPGGRKETMASWCRQHLHDKLGRAGRLCCFLLPS